MSLVVTEPSLICLPAISPFANDLTGAATDVWDRATNNASDAATSDGDTGRSERMDDLL